MRYRVTTYQVVEGKEPQPIFASIVTEMSATDATRAVLIAMEDMRRAMWVTSLAADVEIDIRVRKLA